MLRVILFQQWKGSRLLLFLAGVAAFAVPVLTASAYSWTARSSWDPAGVLLFGYAVGFLYPAIAAATGLIVAITAWGPDHRGGHVYALSLPLPRWRYAGVRFVAGVVLLTVPVLMLGIGTGLVAITAPIPEGLTVYPAALTVRFALAALVAYGMFFAVAAGTTKTAATILGILAGLVVLQVVLTAFGVRVNILGGVTHALFNWPGPFDIFGGRWLLIDV